MYTKEEDKNLRISKIHHKRKKNTISTFGKILGMTSILMINPMMTFGNETFEDEIIQKVGGDYKIRIVITNNSVYTDANNNNFVNWLS